jgi:hypothetical protein
MDFSTSGATRHLGLGQLAPWLGGVPGSEPAHAATRYDPNHECRTLPRKGTAGAAAERTRHLTLIEPDSAGGCYSCV